MFDEHGIGLAVPRVAGVDLAGPERATDHKKYAATMKEAFDKCVLLTIHAGEDEEEKNIWDAIFALHAQRIGHALRLEENGELKDLIRDRRITIELCPTSNQYTNGYHLSGTPYVYKAYKDGHLTLTIGTDDPWISHRIPSASAEIAQPYPLSDEFLVLPLLFPGTSPQPGRENVGKVTRLDILNLIFNGFDNAFLPAPDREALVSLADLELFLVLTKHDLAYEPYRVRVLE
jgi:hypothetical protein